MYFFPAFFPKKSANFGFTGIITGIRPSQSPHLGLLASLWR
jgi:hypothetical protein